MEKNENKVDRSEIQMKRIIKQKNRGQRGLGYVSKQTDNNSGFADNKKKEFHEKIEKIEKIKIEKEKEFIQEKNDLVEKSTKNDQNQDQPEFSKFESLKRKTLKSQKKANLENN